MAKPQLSVHPAAAIFPMMDDGDLAELGESIKKHGLREKIHAIPSVHEDRTDWQVLDGRNRLEALRRAGFKDETIIAEYMIPVEASRYNATEAEYVLMANIERRNLTRPQRQELAGKLAVMIADQQKDKPKAEQVDSLGVAAQKAGVSRRTAATAKAKEVTVAGGVAKKPAKKPGKPKATAGQVAFSLRNALERAKTVPTDKWDTPTFKQCIKDSLAIVKQLEVIAEKRAGK